MIDFYIIDIYMSLYSPRRKRRRVDDISRSSEVPLTNERHALWTNAADHDVG
jgi:hypothetical protein